MVYLIAGAGKSSAFLIEYLLRHAPADGAHIIVADGSEEAIRAKTGDNSHSESAAVDITSALPRRHLVRRADCVLSLMPPHLHLLLAQDCLAEGKPIITASYVSPEMSALDGAFKEAGLPALCEMGLDPGIDHMSALEIFHRIGSAGGSLTAFRSYCGGLVAPRSDDNPWHYKFSWNPRNIVTAGHGGARYLLDSEEVVRPYETLFSTTDRLTVPGFPHPLAAYPNRDSIPYIAKYGLQGIRTFERATLRHPEFMDGWHALISLGLTADDDGQPTAGQTARTWTARVTHCPPGTDECAHLTACLGADSPRLLPMLQSLGLLSKEPLEAIGPHATSADVLLYLLLPRWSMHPTDADAVVMQHVVDYTNAEGAARRLTSSLVLEGEGGERSAMARTVGLPMGIAARGLTQGRMAIPPGVHIPILPQIYAPVLAELSEMDIRFAESDVAL